MLLVKWKKIVLQGNYIKTNSLPPSCWVLSYSCELGTDWLKTLHCLMTTLNWKSWKESSTCFTKRCSKATAVYCTVSFSLAAWPEEQTQDCEEMKQNKSDSSVDFNSL